MKITDYAIRHKITIYVFVLILVLFGGYSYWALPREAAPDITIPFIVISTIYIGAPPQDIEKLVTRPIEQELQGLENVKETRSTSVEGASTITVEFNPDEDINNALQRVKDKVDLAKQDLPEDIEDPVVMEINFSNIPMMIVNLSGNYGLIRLKEVAEDLADEIETIPGILEVRLAGGLEREVKVDVDPERLAAYNLSLENVIDAVRNENVTLPGGSLDIGQYKYSVRVPGELETVAEIGDLLVQAENDQPIYIRDVAEVSYGFKDRATYARLNGRPCVSLSVIKRSGENLIAISDRVKSLVEERNTLLPPGTDVHILADQSDDIRMMVKDLENNIISGLLLVVGVLFLFMGVRNAFFVGIAIPLSMLITFLVLAAFNITLNMVVLFSLILALGMLVDNAIVIIENIYRHRQEGKDKDTGARAGTNEVAVPVITSTLTTLCAFAPMIFWPGIMGEFMKYLPITLIITLASSLLVGLLINPTFCASFMNVKGSQAETSPYLNNVLKRYRHRLEWALDRPWTTMFASGGTLVLVILVYGFLGHGVEFFPEVEPNKAYIDVRAPSGTSLETSNELVRTIETIFGKYPDVQSYISNVGSSGDVEFTSGEGVPHKSRLTLDFVAEHSRTQSTFKTIEQIRNDLADLTGAEIEITKERSGPPTGAPISIEISGEDFDMLGQIAPRVKRIAAAVPGVVDIKDDYDRGRPEIRVVVNREAAALAGL
ncbi:MAG: efflux RND transporter permease subunit, partial [bacterium]|nr:efflux RND transporter permease subunit [bacterium]